MWPEVEALEFPRFCQLLRREWEPGQHIAIVAPTHQGKTTLLHGILTRCGRKFILALDAKGGDSNLAKLGWPRVPGLPTRKKWWQIWRRDIYDDMAEGKPYRRIVGNVARTKEDRARLNESLRATLDDVFEVGGFTVAIDEFQVLADKRMMDLGTEVETLLIAARDRGVSVITLFQAPRWVPRAAVDQCEWVMVGLTRDKDVVDRIAEILGRSRAEVHGAVEGLASRDFSWLVARNNPRKGLIVTRPYRI